MKKKTTKKKFVLPTYVKLLTGENPDHFSALRLIKDSEAEGHFYRGDRPYYWKDYGSWGVRFKVEKGKIIIDEPKGSMADHLHGMELVKCTEKEWKDQN